MKHLFLIIGFFIASLNINAQDTTTVYFDKSWHKTTKTNASFYRKIIKKSKKEYLVNDYYLNGILQMTGVYTSKNLKKKEGKFTYFHENGQKSSEGLFEDGDQSGLWHAWYPSGAVHDEGKYIEGKKQDEWKWYFETGQISAREVYNEDNLVTIEFWDETGNKIAGDLEPIVKPQFIGGEGVLLKYIAEHVRYPQETQENNIEGTAYIRFAIGFDGKIEDAEVFRSAADRLLDLEALRVVKGMPHWIPGKEHNLPKKIYFIVPIKFRLE